jgi:GNAT superfamily N-acetyltransferase
MRVSRVNGRPLRIRYTLGLTDQVLAAVGHGDGDCGGVVVEFGPAGTGGALIAEVERWAREQSCARVYWHTQSSNETARRLYGQVAENRGFIQYLIQL